MTALRAVGVVARAVNPSRALRSLIRVGLAIYDGLAAAFVLAVLLLVVVNVLT